MSIIFHVSASRETYHWVFQDFGVFLFSSYSAVSTCKSSSANENYNNNNNDDDDDDNNNNNNNNNSYDNKQYLLLLYQG